MICSVLSRERREEEEEKSRKSCECAPFFPPSSFIFTTSLIRSDVKAQIGPSLLPPVYITELIKERMVIKK